MNARHLYKLTNKYDAEYTDINLCICDRKGKVIWEGTLDKDMVGICYDTETQEHYPYISLGLADYEIGGNLIYKTE